MSWISSFHATPSEWKKCREFLDFVESDRRDTTRDAPRADKTWITVVQDWPSNLAHPAPKERSDGRG
jgi:hypothetical protein